MTASVSIVGATGRVGSAILAHLGARFAVSLVERVPGDEVVQLAERAVLGADLLINAAGVAHVEKPTLADIERLKVGNIDLPLALAEAALAERISMLHISSVKAGDSEASSSPYATSKREAEEQLERRFGPAFESDGLSLVVVRPLALLFPPLDAGRVSRLKFLRRWPVALTPPVSLPVLAPATFLAAIELLVDQVLAGLAPLGFTRREFDANERGTLRDVREAMVRWERSARLEVGGR